MKENVNVDFAKQVVINANEMEWQPSPSKGVMRKPLAREGLENGHATSIVRYEAGAKFQTHTHPLGEEIYVLDGVFSDENGDYPAGSYLRHPPGSKHAPYSEDGCVIFVKLQQFNPLDQLVVNVDTNTQNWYQGQGNLKVMPLHEFQGQNTALVFWPAGERFSQHKHWGGEEILVLKGEFIDEHGRYPQGTWIRSPHLSQHFPFVEQDTTILVKTGHLPD